MSLAAQAVHSVLNNSRSSLLDRYRAVRAATEYLCAGLQAEDTVAQSMADASPIKWHLAHTSWFFETLVLEKASERYLPVNPQYRVLFNSYYNSVGAQYLRSQRGLISRPGLQQVMDYRRIVDERIIERLSAGSLAPELAAIVEVGLHHEQQHQELMLTDLKHLFSCNPLNPVYRAREELPLREVPALQWRTHAAGLYEVGYCGDSFAFDNETPRHPVYLPAYAIASRPVSNGEYLAFIDDGGYDRPEWWLSDAWAIVCKEQWCAPLYWRRQGDEWHIFTLSGLRQLRADEPVVHLSYYEADAYARWAGARLPTEQEWEVAAQSESVDGNFVEHGQFHPLPAQTGNGLQQLFGDVWEWTQSPYVAYPGYRPPGGELAEYNGKFMCNQLVLRGGSCATPQSHMRPSYRNFFFPQARWQFSGLRLAQDV